jgi:cytochrome b
MNVMQGLRAYHAVLGSLVVLAFLTGEAGLIHAVLGYAIAVIILGRLAAALSGVRQLGLSRFFPQFAASHRGSPFTHPAISKVLLAGIAGCLIAATVTGIELDRGRTLGLAGQAVVASAQAESERGEHRDRAGARRGGEAGHGGEGRGEGGDGHEFLSNLLMILVGAHVAYLLAFKWPVARFMLFRSGRGTPAAGPATGPAAVPVPPLKLG